MKLDSLRPLLFGVVVLLLVGGYAASQWFFFAGQATKWSQAIDVPSVKFLSLALLIGMIAMGVGGSRK